MEDKNKRVSSARKKANRVREMFLAANNSHRVKWLHYSQKSYEFFNNIQLTKEEEDQLRESGMPTFIINKITPAIEVAKYFITANNPRFKAVGTGAEDVGFAEVYEKLIEYCWYISSGKLVFSNVVQDALVKSKGYIHVYIDRNSDRGKGDVKFEYVDPFHVYVSPLSTDPFERDASYKIIRKDFARSDLINMLPEYKDKIRRASGISDAISMTERDVESNPLITDVDVRHSPQPYYDENTNGGDILPYYEMYELVKFMFMNVTYKAPVSQEELRKSKEIIDATLNSLKEELEVKYLELKDSLEQALQKGEIIPERAELELKKARENIDAEVEYKRAELYDKVEAESSRIEEKVVTEEEYDILVKAIGENIISAIPFYENRVRKTCVVGDTLLYEYLLDVPEIPLVALPYNHTGTPYPLSAVTPVIGKQQEINKAHQIMIHHANLASNLRFLYARGEIDEEEWQRYSSSPSALLSYNPGLSPGGPREITPQPINNAFFTIENESKSDIDYILGIFPNMLGQVVQRDETYRGLLARDEFGTRRIRSWIGNVLEPFLEIVGKIWAEFARNLYTAHKVFRIVQPNESGVLESQSYEINVPIYNDYNNEIGKFNDLSAVMYDIRIVPGSTLPVNRWAKSEEMKELFTLGVIDDIELIKTLDIKDKEALMERKSMIMQMKGEIESLKRQLEEKDSRINSLLSMVTTAKVRSAVENSTREIYRSELETKAQDKLYRKLLKSKKEENKEENK